MPPRTMKPKLVLVANWPWMQWGVTRRDLDVTRDARLTRREELGT